MKKSRQYISAGVINGDSGGETPLLVAPTMRWLLIGLIKAAIYAIAFEGGGGC